MAEALTTHGTALAQLHRTGHARAAFARAISVAEEAGDKQGAGLAALAMVEELGSASDELRPLRSGCRAAKLLEESREIAIVHRLAGAASYVLSGVRNYLEIPPTVDWTKFSFPDAVLDHWSAGKLFGNVHQPADFFARIQNLTGVSQADLVSKLTAELGLFTAEQDNFVSANLNQSEKLAHAVSDLINPKYLYQNCGRY